MQRQNGTDDEETAPRGNFLYFNGNYRKIN